MPNWTDLNPAGVAFNPMLPRATKAKQDVWPFPTTPQNAVHWMASKMAERGDYSTYVHFYDLPPPEWS